MRNPDKKEKIEVNGQASLYKRSFARGTSFYLAFTEYQCFLSVLRQPRFLLFRA